MLVCDYQYLNNNVLKIIPGVKFFLRTLEDLLSSGKPFDPYNKTYRLAIIASTPKYPNFAVIHYWGDPQDI